MSKAKYSKGPKYGYWGQAGLDAEAALKLAKQTAALLNVERKAFDRNSVAAAMTSTPIIVPLTNIDAGTGGADRTGDQVKTLRVRIRATVKMHASASQTNVRLMLVHDRQTNGAAFSPGDLLTKTAIGAGIISYTDPDSKYRFKVLADDVRPMSSSGMSMAKFEFQVKSMIHLRYNGTGGGIADVVSSGLSLVHLCDEATNTPTITYQTRVVFVDN